MNIQEAFEEIRRAFPSGDPGANQARGAHFEKIVKAFFQNDPRYKGVLSEVWLWNEWNKRLEGDTGVDIVAKEQGSGNLWAIQCKFYEPDAPISKGDIDSFFATSGRYGFSQRIIVSTSDNWSFNARKTLEGQSIPCKMMGISQLADSPLEFTSIYHPEKATTSPKKKLRPHQRKALNDVVAGFQHAERGKLIMACGTGKTFTSLKIAEQIASQSDAKGNILFLIPSISLLSQSLREWATEADIPQRNFAVCSDSKVGKDDEGMRAYELAFPTTTDYKILALKLKQKNESGRVNIIFSTYHSIDVVAKAQKHGAPQFDLVICDEAHRTTGIERQGEDASYFSKIHNSDYIHAKKRLYMTATPRIYSDSAKAKAQKHDIDYFSMDDSEVYGEEFHRLDFSDAVEKDLLADYRVLVLAVNEQKVSTSMQSEFAEDGELKLQDAAKIIGCYSGLRKRIINREEVAGLDSTPMRRAVAFANTIKASQYITARFSQIITAYQAHNADYEERDLKCEFKHVDGTQNSMQRDSKLNWLREPQAADQSICRVLSNARCLSEGVDVPALDAVMFLNPRKSVVDVVQSVGRVMRKAKGKQYGYVILPVSVPTNKPAHESLHSNKTYQVVWQVLQALRAHDNRFNAIINKLELNKSDPDQIEVIGVGFDDEDEDGDDQEGVGVIDEKTIEAEQLSLNFDDLRDAIYAQIVIRCGDRKYWDTWAKDIATIADNNTTRIKNLISGSHASAQDRFQKFHNDLQTNINPSISEAEAIEMLSQHLITKPVFNALFENYDFAAKNPVSKAMQSMLDVLEDNNLQAETQTLEKFYRSVQQRAAGIDNAAGKQKIIIELYDKFFKNAFPKMTERLGIVYTPVEVVDFILQSVQDTMQKEFGKGLTDQGVDILDPFTGTGSFIVRMLQGKYIHDRDLKRKYQNEIHANEIVLLAYYIAAINIEEAYHFRAGGDYEPFDGILFSDTFQLGEGKRETHNIFPENFARADKQNKRNIRVIVGNPPYSVGQRSENDANKNVQYPKLDAAIRNTYAKHSTITNKRSIYDSYVRAIRWASDRIGNEGIIAYVSNNSYIDSNSTGGVRKVLSDDFSAIYCFNLRGDINKDISNKSLGEGKNIFGQGSKVGIAVTLFIKNPQAKNRQCRIYYHDIGSNLKTQQKLDKIKEAASAQRITWQAITPNAEHDWINQRHPEFATFLPLGDKANKRKIYSDASIFVSVSNGVKTNRDVWVYNFSSEGVAENMQKMINFYNDEVRRYQKEKPTDVEQFIGNDKTKISWVQNLKMDLKKGKSAELDARKIRLGMYRPFCKQHLYFDRQMIWSPYLHFQYFPYSDSDNVCICVAGIGASTDFSALLVDTVPDVHIVSPTKCFPFYTYAKTSSGLGGSETRMENISDATMRMFRTHYTDSKITKWDIFYYVYGLLHAPQYRSKYAADLKKMLPRLPMHKDFRAFSRAGKALGDLHVNYEKGKEYPLKEVATDLVANEKREVVKIQFAKQNGVTDNTAIVYNHHLTLQGIPMEAYNYVVNGKSAIEWVMGRYQMKTDKDSKIINNPNLYSTDPSYIVKLLKKVVHVSVESVKIVDSLPPLEE